MRNIIAALALAVLVAAPPVRACLNATRAEESSYVAGVSQAQKALRLRDYPRAAELARRAMDVEHDVKDGGRAAQRVLAMAVIRSRGSLGLDPPGTRVGRAPGSTLTDAQARVSLAVDLLQDVLQRDSVDDAGLRTVIAEGQAQLPDRHAVALAALDALAAADLMVGADGYAALARLRAEAGDVAGHDAAVARCQQLSKDRTLCTASPSS